MDNHFLVRFEVACGKCVRLLFMCNFRKSTLSDSAKVTGNKLNAFSVFSKENKIILERKVAWIHSNHFPPIHENLLSRKLVRKVNEPKSSYLVFYQKKKKKKNISSSCYSFINEKKKTVTKIRQWMYEVLEHHQMYVDSCWNVVRHFWSLNISELCFIPLKGQRICRDELNQFHSKIG